MTAGTSRRREIAWVVAALFAMATAIVVIVLLATSTTDDADGDTSRGAPEAAVPRDRQDAGLAASHSKPGRRSRDSAAKDVDANAPDGAAAPPGGVRIGQATSGRAGDAPHAAPVAAETGTPPDSETATAKAKRDAAGPTTSRATRIRTPQTFVVHVTAAESGLPVRAAAIDLRPRAGEPIRAQTDGEGRAPFTLPPDVAFDLEAKSRGRLRVRRDGVTAPAPDTVIEVALERGVVVKGNVRGPKGPIAAATVRAYELAPYLKAIPYDPDPRPVEETQTDRSGAYRLDCIPRGVACALVVEADRFPTSGARISAQPDPDYVVRRDVTLVAGTALTGFVRDEVSKPVESAWVVAFERISVLSAVPSMSSIPPDDRTDIGTLQAVLWLRTAFISGFRSTTDKEGRFQLVVPSAWGKVVAMALHATAGRSRTTDAFEPSKDTPTLVLRSRVQSEFEVWTPDGKPAKGVEIKPHWPWETWTAPSIAPGRYGLSSIDDGVLLIDVAGPVEAPGTYIGRRIAMKRITWNVQLRSGLTWEGTVRDDRKFPIEGALVTAGIRMATTDADGRFILRGVHPDETMAEASAPGHGSDRARVSESNARSLEIVLRRTAFVRLQLELPQSAATPTWRRVWVGRSAADPWDEHASLHDDLDWNQGALRLGIDGGSSDLLAVFVPGYQVATREIAPRPGEDADLGRLALEPARRFRGVVVDDWNAPVPDAEVRVQLLSSPPWRDMLPERSVDTNTQGEFEIELPAPDDKYWLIASAPGYLATPTHLEPAEGKPQTIVLGKAKRFIGRVNSWNRSAGVVWLRGPHGEFYAEALVDEGGAFATEVPLRPSKAQFFQDGKPSGKPTQEADVPADWRDSDLFRFP